MPPPPEDRAPRVPLIDSAGLADRWGVTTERLRQVADSPGFPPYQVANRGRVWLLADIEAWEASEVAAGRSLPGGAARGRPPTGRRPSVPETPGEGIERP